MDRTPNSFEEVAGVTRISGSGAAPWQRQQRLQQWKIHLQRLAAALENGDLKQARYEFEALVNDVPEPGQADPMAHPQFAYLGKALERQDLEGAREAFHHMQTEVPSLRDRHPQTEGPRKQPAGKATEPVRRKLDVTA